MKKRGLILIVLSIIIYFFLLFIHSKFVSNNLKEVYILTQEVNRGDNLSNSNLKKVKIVNTLSFDYVENVENILAKYNLKSGHLLKKEDVIKKQDYTLIDEDKESVVLQLSDISKNYNNCVSKGNIVNIYYTGRSSQLKGILNTYNFKELESSSITDGYTTILLIKDIEINEVYDKNGDVIYNKSSNIGSINVLVDSKIVILIENIRKYGEFSVTVKR